MDTAERLRQEIGEPLGVLSVWAWHEDDGSVRLIVRITPGYPVELDRIPTTFEDHPVSIQESETPRAVAA